MKHIVSSILILSTALVFSQCANQKVVTTTSSGGLQSVYFDYDQSFIRSDATSVMQGNASYLKGNTGASVTIEGNCDNRGTNEYNLALGQHRADSSRDYLVNLGVSSTRLRTVSFGEEKQVCFSGDENCWQRNRRADFRKN